MAEAKAGVAADGTRIETAQLWGDGFVVMGVTLNPRFSGRSS
jgi:hypothetical protein